jgi:hypothetical protein
VAFGGPYCQSCALLVGRPGSIGQDWSSPRSTFKFISFENHGQQYSFFETFSCRVLRNSWQRRCRLQKSLRVVCQRAQVVWRRSRPPRRLLGASSPQLVMSNQNHWNSSRRHIIFCRQDVMTWERRGLDIASISFVLWERRGESLLWQELV